MTSRHDIELLKRSAWRNSLSEGLSTDETSFREGFDAGLTEALELAVGPLNREVNLGFPLQYLFKQLGVRHEEI